jgi:hypothetical protein
MKRWPNQLNKTIENILFPAIKWSPMLNKISVLNRGQKCLRGAFIVASLSGGGSGGPGGFSGGGSGGGGGPGDWSCSGPGNQPSVLTDSDATDQTCHQFVEEVIFLDVGGA